MRARRKGWDEAGTVLDGGSLAGSVSTSWIWTNNCLKVGRIGSPGLTTLGLDD